MHGKHLALNNRHVPMYNKLIFNGGTSSRVIVPVHKQYVDELTQSVGGLLISDKGNIYKGGKVNRVPPRRPIKFII